MSAITGIGDSFTIRSSARTSSSRGTAQRTRSPPASAMAWICFMVASKSAVSVLAMDCTATGAPPPIFTPPTSICFLEAMKPGLKPSYGMRALVPFRRVPEGLGGRRVEGAAKQGQEAVALFGAQPAQNLVLDLDDQVPGLPQAAPALRRDRDLPCAAIRGGRAALRKPGALELVDQRHHSAAIDAQRPAQLLLDRSLASADHVQDREQGRRQADRAKQLRGARVGRPPEPEEELPGELGDRRLGGRMRCHADSLSY